MTVGTYAPLGDEADDAVYSVKELAGHLFLEISPMRHGIFDAVELEAQVGVGFALSEPHAFVVRNYIEMDAFVG